MCWCVHEMYKDLVGRLCGGVSFLPSPWVLEIELRSSGYCKCFYSLAISVVLFYFYKCSVFLKFEIKFSCGVIIFLFIIPSVMVVCVLTDIKE